MSSYTERVLQQTTFTDPAFSPAYIDDALVRIGAARVMLLRDHPFFGSLVMRLRPFAGEVHPSGTMGVMADGGMVFEPPFVLGLPLPEVGGGLAHETLHLAGDVFGRRGDRDPYLWNIAHDLTINLLIVACGIPLPKGALLDQAFEGMTAEEIYEILVREEATKGRSRSRGSSRGRNNPLGKHGVGCADHLDPENRRRARGDWSGTMSPDAWRGAIAEAAENARMRGMMPAALDRYVGQLLQPKLTWQAVLARTARGVLNRSETSWRVPSRRSFAAGVRLAGRIGTGYEASIALDTSASIDEEQLRRSATEAEEIMRLVGAHVTVYCADAEVASEISARSIHDVSVKGGGGTDFGPVFQRIAEHPGRRCRMLVYFTDLAGKFPVDNPPYPVVWCVPREYEERVEPPPFGTVLFF